jgi:hypothetical protein
VQPNCTHEIDITIRQRILTLHSIVGIAVSGSTFYLYRLSQGSEVVWDRKGDWKPWDKIKQHENVSVGLMDLYRLLIFGSCSIQSSQRS